MAPSIPEAITSSEEQAVIAAVQAGNTAFFAKLVTAYQDRLFGAMCIVLGNRQDAEDVTQEAFAKAFLKLDTFQGRSSFFTWLHRIARHVAIDNRRRGWRERQQRNADVGDVHDLASSTLMRASDPGPAEAAERKENHQRLYRALATMDEERREVITLRDLQGLDYAEIAEILQLPIGTVRSRLHRARLELRGLLADLASDEGVAKHASWSLATGEDR
jgi:RNA polymerase sigma-70 factor (ECF subfamily)